MIKNCKNCGYYKDSISDIHGNCNEPGWINNCNKGVMMLTCSKCINGKTTATKWVTIKSKKRGQVCLKLKT